MSQDGRSERLTKVISIACITAMGCCFLLWWDSFHEVGRFLFLKDPLFASPEFANPGDVVYTYVSCIMQPAGMAFGCLILYLATRKTSVFSPTFVQMGVFFALELLLHCCYWTCITIVWTPVTACIVHGLVSACFVVNMTGVILFLSRFSRREIAIVAIACLLLFGLVNNLAFVRFMYQVPRALYGGVYALLLFAGYGLIVLCKRREILAVSLQPGDKSDATTPAPLAVHLLLYGFTFGVLHTISGGLASGPSNINSPLFFSCLIGAAVIALLFLRPQADGEIWAQMRSTVFPLTIIGLMLVPLVPNSDVALAVLDSGQLLYEAMLCIACTVLIGRTFVLPHIIVIKAFFFKSMGMVLGIWAIAFTDLGILIHTPDVLSLLSVFIVVLLVIATFWVGTDKQVHRIWGLRKNLSPKRYNETIVKAKCEKLTADNALTESEGEILLALALGKHASEIKLERQVSINTVRSHIQHVYTKLDVHSTGELSKLLKSIVIEEKSI